jgi:Mg2+-importing ATPase
MIPASNSYYSSDEKSLLISLGTRPEGLSYEEADRRLKEFGFNSLKRSVNHSNLRLFLNQFKNALTLILIASAILSFFLGEQTDAVIILVIVFASAILGFYQERGAANAVRKLLEMVCIDTRVVRDGREISVPIEHIVPGDIALLSAGDMVPGDCRLLESRDLFCNEATLTGETFPSEKKCSILTVPTRIAERTNTVFMGTNITSGMARAVVVKTGAETEFGTISQHLGHAQPETDFQKGIRHFGFFLMQITLVLMLGIFSINIALHKPILDSFLFSLAIAVGLTPQLLPAIISINLAKGASNMAKQKVIVKKLASIENLGSMNILCSDKTGTLTEGKVVVHRSVNYNGDEDEEVFKLAYLNAYFESGFLNPLDEAIRTFGNPDISGMKKLDELPYDFIRKCLSIAVTGPSGNLIITKGAFDQVLGKCDFIEKSGGDFSAIDAVRKELIQRYQSFGREGYRIIAVAYKPVPPEFERMSKTDESKMCFKGMLLLSDPPKNDAAATIDELKKLGISLKVITGDSVSVAEHLSKQIGIDHPVICSGSDLSQMTSEALIQQANNINVFAAVEPNQKERILVALKKSGNVVGFIGDGINDAPALHTADVGISVDSAVDVAKEAADIVLLGKDLQVLISGVKEGRKTFANTLKYIFMATSANFGNMFSMAGSSLFLSFLPLLPKQVLLTNLLTDIPEMTIATDSVDSSMISQPRRINLAFIRKFMIVFGIISSIFDYITFGLLLFWLHANVDQFRTGWLIESVLSASAIVLIVRTSQPFYRSMPGRYLLLATVSVMMVVTFLPLTFFAPFLGIVPLPAIFYLWVLIIILLYVMTAEIAKKIFYRMVAVK